MGIAIHPTGNGYPVHELSVEAHSDPAAHRPHEERRSESPLPESLREPTIDSTARQLEQVSLAFNKKLRFEVNEELDRVIVKVIDPATDKVIKELPPEELQRLEARIREMIGLLFDERV